MHSPHDLLCPHQQPLLVNHTFTVRNWNGVWKEGVLVFLWAPNPSTLTKNIKTPDRYPTHTVYRMWLTHTPGRMGACRCGGCYFVWQSGHKWQAYKISRFEHVFLGETLAGSSSSSTTWQPSPVDWFFYYVKIKEAYTGMFLHWDSLVVYISFEKCNAHWKANMKQWPLTVTVLELLLSSLLCYYLMFFLPHIYPFEVNIQILHTHVFSQEADIKFIKQTLSNWGNIDSFETRWYS